MSKRVLWGTTTQMESVGIALHLGEGRSFRMWIQEELLAPTCNAGILIHLPSVLEHEKILCQAAVPVAASQVQLTLKDPLQAYACNAEIIIIFGSVVFHGFFSLENLSLFRQCKIHWENEREQHLCVLCSLSTCCLNLTTSRPKNCKGRSMAMGEKKEKKTHKNKQHLKFFPKFQIWVCK